MKRDPVMFWACVAVTSGDDRCWEWQKSVDTRGYGHVMWGSPSEGGKIARAHRIAYELAVGPIPAGKWLLHSCDNRRCVRPSHLRPGNRAENMTDMVERNRRKNIGCADENGRSKLTWDQVEAIRADTRGQRIVARAYGISPAQVWRIRSGQQWRA